MAASVGYSDLHSGGPFGLTREAIARLLELVPLDLPGRWEGAESSVGSVCNDVLLVRLSAILYIVLAQQ